MFDLLQQFLFWLFIPGFIAKFLLNQYLSIFKRGTTLQPNDARYRRMYNAIYTFVVASYLLYSIIQTERGMPPNYYNTLGVNIEGLIDTRELRTNYRALSLLYHPDKTQGVEDARYREVRLAYDTLKEPLHRRVYEKFGQTVSDCTQCKEDRDFVIRAIYGSLMFYLGTAGMVLFMSIIGRISFGLYWRLAIILACASIEANWLLSSIPSLQYVLPWRTSFEKILVLRQILFNVSIAISQIGPVFQSSDNRPTRQIITELEQIVDMQVGLAIRSFADEFAPFHEDPKGAGLLQRKMELLVSTAIPK